MYLLPFQQTRKNKILGYGSPWPQRSITTCLVSTYNVLETSWCKAAEPFTRKSDLSSVCC